MKQLRIKKEYGTWYYEKKWDAEVMNKYDEEGSWVYDLYDERGEFVTEFITYDSMRLYITEGVLI